jgi:hypothetical protein
MRHWSGKKLLVIFILPFVSLVGIRFVLFHSSVVSDKNDRQAISVTNESPPPPLAETRSIQNKIDTNEIATPKQEETHDYSAVVFETHNWVFNKDVMQFSAYAQINSNKQVEIRSVLTFRGAADRNCICIASDDNKKFSKKPIESMTNLNYAFKDLYVVKCVFEASEFSNASNIFVSVVRETEFSNTIADTATLFAHRPKFYELKAKELGVTNCVHTLRTIDSTRYKDVLNWLEINIALGVSSMTFYFMDQDDSVLNKILAHHPNFVEVIRYRISTQLACSKLEPHGLKDCAQLYGFIFHESMFNFHERLCTNDCKLNIIY